jgi:ABC-type transport system involved in multi-copper enzyme maturation permease subunit
VLFSAVAPMALAEERQRGSLDILMATPLSTRTIVMGKWLGTFRLVPWVALGPGLMALALATAGPPAGAIFPIPDEMALLERGYGVGLFIATILIHGAAIAGAGLLAATWIPRQARAIAVSVTLFLLVSVGWPFLIFNATATRLGPNVPSAALSPFMVTAEFVDGLAFRHPRFKEYMLGTTLWDILVAVVAIALLECTVRTFERRLGRMPGNLTPVEAGPADKPKVYDAIAIGG